MKVITELRHIHFNLQIFILNLFILKSVTLHEYVYSRMSSDSANSNEAHKVSPSSHSLWLFMVAIFFFKWITVNSFWLQSQSIEETVKWRGNINTGAANTHWIILYINFCAHWSARNVVQKCWCNWVEKREGNYLVIFTLISLRRIWLK
jgi:hypothetical protein